MADQGTWPKDKIKELAAESGKPLEVLCGQAFLGSRTGSWKPYLGSYFQDGERARELDVLAERKEVLPKSGILCRLRAIVSCRGFPDDAAPLTYSIEHSSPLLRRPGLLATYRRPSQYASPQEDSELSIHLGMDMAPKLLSGLGLDTQQSVVALDVIQRDKEKQRRSARVGSPAIESEQSFKLKGDERLYGAIDSAVKGAFHWAAADQQSAADGYVTLNVPICVFSIPFWDVAIDHGRISDPEQRTRSYQTNAYPVFASLYGRGTDYVPLSTLLVSYSEMDAVVAALDDLFFAFRDDFLVQTSDMIRKHGE